MYTCINAGENPEVSFAPGASASLHRTACLALHKGRRAFTSGAPAGYDNIERSLPFQGLLAGLAMGGQRCRR